mgnify:FL=1
MLPPGLDRDFGTAFEVLKNADWPIGVRDFVERVLGLLFCEYLVVLTVLSSLLVYGGFSTSNYGENEKVIHRMPLSPTPPLYS